MDNDDDCSTSWSLHHSLNRDEIGNHQNTKLTMTYTTYIYMQLMKTKTQLRTLPKSMSKEKDHLWTQEVTIPTWTVKDVTIMKSEVKKLRLVFKLNLTSLAREKNIISLMTWPVVQNTLPCTRAHTHSHTWGRGCHYMISIKKALNYILPPASNFLAGARVERQVNRSSTNLALNW